MLRTVFDVASLNARKIDLENLSAQPDFWNDQLNAQKQMRLLDDVKAQLEQLSRWHGLVEDAKATIELLEIGPDEEMLGEAQSALIKLKTDLDKWELERLLSGAYD